MEQTNIKKTADSLENIFLIGFMCSGKTSAGALLAKKLKRKFKDSDAELEKTYKKSPAKIIKKKGIRYFRVLEEKTVKKIIKEKNIIIAMGGGIMASKKWNKYLKDKGSSVYLSCSIEELKKRLLKTKEDRPLIGKGSGKEIGLKTKELLAKRAPYYNKANFKLSVTKLTPAQTAKKIERIIKTPEAG
ncbi:MAG: shikimate kinase [Elusimicrobiota bacterium]|nr:shikimate kinase [Elusimicrobiota bacterium]